MTQPTGTSPAAAAARASSRAISINDVMRASQVFALYKDDDARHKAAMTKQQPESGFEGERIAKVMARAGLCSRREAESWIADGRVAVNGATIKSPALNIGADDTVAVDGKPLPKAE